MTLYQALHMLLQTGVNQITTPHGTVRRRGEEAVEIIRTGRVPVVCHRSRAKLYVLDIV